MAILWRNVKKKHAGCREIRKRELSIRKQANKKCGRNTERVIRERRGSGVGAVSKTLEGRLVIKTVWLHELFGRGFAMPLGRLVTKADWLQGPCGYQGRLLPRPSGYQGLLVTSKSKVTASFVRTVCFIQRVIGSSCVLFLRNTPQVCSDAVEDEG